MMIAGWPNGYSSERSIQGSFLHHTYPAPNRIRTVGIQTTRDKRAYLEKGLYYEYDFSR